MNKMYVFPPIFAVIAVTVTLLVKRGRKIEDMHVYGALFIGAIGFFCLGRLIGDGFGVVSGLIAVAANATCGWSWLMARALFRPKAVRASPWPLATVLILVLAGGFVQLAGPSMEPLTHMVINIQGLTGSTVLLLALSEPLRDIRNNMPQAERGFRVSFLTGYATLTAVAVLWASGAPEGSVTAEWSNAVKVSCAFLAMLGASIAIYYRSHAPLSEPVKRRAATHDDELLAARILNLISDDRFYTTPNLKVADLARHVNEAEYKVTQCITGALGFRNFNHMINHFRINQAASQLADRDFDHLPVLTIALDCGFGSIGPFNRAFKTQFGDTPTAFREVQRRGAGFGSAITQ
ncbi:helix-turn-helix domain-containing protein [Asticcacaulis tiandongensis]|uniref:helix-turn-helix domain-containing protein n=1 Tax=Asticcacaulis tiandongensis TaxID=2565365 RepID=UPI001FE274D4|nr:AraC family transcriptional regulator [Asticcacaulis tiandongensis]